ncbi:MAG: helix-turn-helix domain-containing protein [Corallococcus sp.]|nr:helix-turn-helix domain-containing protein [Corallococcus sp.]
MEKVTLRELRKAAGKSVQEVTEVLGVKKSTYYNYEYGLRKIHIEQVLTLSKLYDITAEEVIEAQLNSCLCVQ